MIRIFFFLVSKLYKNGLNRSCFRFGAVHLAALVITALAAPLARAAQPFPSSPEPGHVRLLTFNIFTLGHRGETSEDLTRIATRIGTFEADLVGVQEVLEQTTWNELYPQIGPAWAAMPDDETPVSSIEFAYNTDRLELLEHDVVHELPNNMSTTWPVDTQPKYPLVGVFRPSAPGSPPFRVMIIHLISGVGGGILGQQLQFLSDLIEYYRSIDPPDMPFVVMGDFNLDETFIEGIMPAVTDGTVIHITKRNGPRTFLQPTVLPNGDLDHHLIIPDQLSLVHLGTAQVIQSADYGEDDTTWFEDYSDHLPTFIDLNVPAPLSTVKSWVYYDLSGASE